jgi:segregation and condensation protein B
MSNNDEKPSIDLEVTLEAESAASAEVTLEAAADEWRTDALVAAQAGKPDAPLDAVAPEVTLPLAEDELRAAAEAVEQALAPVTLITDPFGLKNLEISEAQDSPEAIDEDLEEIDLEEDEEEDAEGTLEASEVPSPESAAPQLERLATELKAEEVRQEQEAAQLAVEVPEVDPAIELARQIAEDEALAKAEAEAKAAADAADAELQAALPREPKEGEDGELDLAEVESCLEALLFMTDKPLTLDKLRELLGPEFAPYIFQEAMTRLRDRYKTANHGIELANIAGGFQFRTKTARAPLARKLAKVTTQKLSSGAMETLSIVAYRQPVMKDDIDKIRGVDSSYFVRGLMDRRLLRISGRSELPGRPMLYSTSNEFLELFGLKDLSELPPLAELEQMVPKSQAGDEDPNVKRLRTMVGEMNSDVSVSLKYDPREDDRILREIKETVAAIPSSTPYLDEQRELEKQAAEGLLPPAEQPVAPELPLPTAE